MIYGLDEVDNVCHGTIRHGCGDVACHCIRKGGTHVGLAQLFLPGALSAQDIPITLYQKLAVAQHIGELAHLLCIGDGLVDNIKKNSNDENKKNEVKNNKENDLIPSLIVRLRGKHSTKYLCSYHFILNSDNSESELDKTIYDDYKILLKKNSLKVRGGEVINFEFNENPTKIRAYIWDDEIKELEINRGTIKVPQLDKKIVVGVEGTYKNGKILYAVVLDIRG